MSPAEMARIHAAAFTRQRPWSAQEFQTLLDSPHTRAFAIPEGFALFRLLPPEAELLTLAILPAHQNQGHARGLMQRADTTLAAAGIATLFLEVSAENAPALTLYRRLGFAATGQRPGYYHMPDGAREDAILMTRAIPAQNPRTRAKC